MEILKKEMNEANDLINKKIGDLIKINNLNCVNFVEIKNKWSDILSGWNCCNNKCINTNNPIGDCTKGNGFINIIDDENIKYIEGKGGCNNFAYVCAENLFKKPYQHCLNYTLYYFEVKCKFQRKLNGDNMWIAIGLKDLNGNYVIRFRGNEATINYKFKLPNFSWNNNDIFGCGLVYPPINKLNDEFPYVFFTQNGKQIGKGVLLKYNSDSYKPCVLLECCSVEANFGSNLETKPFNFDIPNYLVLQEFY
uniref:Uncharacterized protein n=1 Tax=Meloidogyne enterolobii TaxID=390850 RepID=A0A6V7VCQ9_MELEN|nr:unnamed protein product [Meloidogyne enterolobii]